MKPRRSVRIGITSIAWGIAFAGIFALDARACLAPLCQPCDARSTVAPMSQEPLRGGGLVANVSIANLSFNPAQIVVPSGTTVVWTQNDVFTHTVTSEFGVAPPFESGNLTTIGQTFQQVFSSVGLVPYVCSLHFEMAGTIEVRRPGDADGNDAIDLDDFTLLAANFGQLNRGYAQGDFNLDRFVTLDDFTILAANFGQPAPAEPQRSVAVPEPSGAILAAALLLGGRRRILPFRADR